MNLIGAFAVVSTLMLIAPSSLAAQVGTRADRIISAEKLEQSCSSAETSEVGRMNLSYCLGAITGIADAATTLTAFFERDQIICLAHNDNSESMRLAFMSYLQRNPADRELPAATVVITVLAKNYPCKAN